MFPKFSEKRGLHLEVYTHFKNFLSKIPFRFPFILKFSVQWFAFWKFSSFRIIWKLSQELSGPLARVTKFLEFVFKRRAPLVSTVGCILKSVTII